jgi:xylan 1,4-beta-xylosidase
MLPGRLVRRILCVGATLSCVAGFASTARAQDAVTITIDATGAGKPLERIWPFYGFDEVNYATTPAGKMLLQELAKMHTAPVHVRTHFLLNSGDGTASLKWGSTNVYTEDGQGAPVYNFTLLDGIMDAITGAGAFPFAEIAFMPHDLSVHPDPYKNSGVYALDGGCFYPPKDYAKWGALISTWASHVKARYPNAESTWQWELWNEPDIGYWHGTFAEYAKMFDYTEASLHQVLPNAPLGGPAVANARSGFLKQFLQHCASETNAVTGKTGTRLDAVTFHAKGGVAITGGHVQMDLGNQLQLHRDGMSAVAAVPMFKSTPIVVTEADPDGCAACPVSQTPADAYRNSPAYGAYEVAMMQRTLELEARLGVNVRGLLTWAFLFPDASYFPGYRALQANGVDLPVLNAFKLLGRLDGNRVPVTSSGAPSLDDILTSSVRQAPDIDAIATRNGRQVQVLIYNYHDDLVPAAASPVHLALQLPSDFGTSAVVTQLIADETHGDAYTVWTSQGKPVAPSPAQVQQLRDGMEPVAEPVRNVDVVGGKVMLDFALARFGVSLVTLTPVGALDASVDDGPAPDAPAEAASSAPEASEIAQPRNDDAMSASFDDASAGTAASINPGSGSAAGCSCREAPRKSRELPQWVTALLMMIVVRRRTSARRRLQEEPPILRLGASLAFIRRSELRRRRVSSTNTATFLRTTSGSSGLTR